MATRRRNKDRLSGEMDGFACERCGCGLTPDEEYAVTSMTGPGVSRMTFAHGLPQHCIAALVEKVNSLERVVAQQARKLEGCP